jgi:hypothetical protein
MKNLNLEKLWKVCNILSNKERELSEKDVYISFVGYNSEYSEMEFESFIKYYNFGFEDDNIIVFNDDAVSYEKYTNNDFSYIPIILLSFDETRLNNWMETEIKLQLEAQEREKVREKEEIEKQIELLTKKLERCN